MQQVGWLQLPPCQPQNAQQKQQAQLVLEQEQQIQQVQQVLQVVAQHPLRLPGRMVPAAQRRPMLPAQLGVTFQ